ncbi:hypothetical protein IV203_034605 [Nitzschia inconspicua]|uniref:Dirigent protein n=1 Tax=Nitzschia inconspicua TaxID=303405 RepID=A0A9K3P9V5_9STRA|nr:hypothetical protein IV203_002665 [Nitzschia inconspicua]KAG7359507.1 hypothetical protein IV203_034605 [Nitzschia inconspicua]
MIGDSPVNQYGIGTNDDGRVHHRQHQQVLQPPEHPRNHKDSKKSTKSNNEVMGKGNNNNSNNNHNPIRPPVLLPDKPPAHQPSRPPSIRPPSVNPPSTNGNGGEAGNVCQSPMTLQFLQFSAIPPAVFVFPQDPNVQDMGTRYIYNNDLRDAETLDELVGSRSNGICTRTQSRLVDSSGAVLQLGGGHCTFTYTMFDGSREFTMEASGVVADSEGGTLSIVGGTKDAIGAFGEISLTPVNLAPDGNFEKDDGDFFLSPLFYLADAILLVPC